MDVWCFCVEVSYAALKPFYIGSFSVECRRGAKILEALDLAEKEAEEQIKLFFKQRFPSGVEPPSVKKVHLGHMMFVAQTEPKKKSQ